MKIKNIFEQMYDQLDMIAQKYAQSDINEGEVEKELEQLKEQSEYIVEQWLRFEEKLGQFLQGKKETKQLDEEDMAQKLTSAYQDLLTPTIPERDSSEKWKKGKALYDLFMFEQANVYLESVLEADPDFDIARYYLSQSYFAVKKFEQAKYHLQLLLETTQQEEVLSLALHALACLEGNLKNHEKAKDYFEKINMEKVDTQYKATMIFNYSQTLYQLSSYEKCLEQLITYYQLKPNDWQAAYFLGKVYHKLGQEEAGYAFWLEALQLQENEKVLMEMAVTFEEKSLFQMAAQCYERILKLKPYSMNEKAWFGLAWNYCMNNNMNKGYLTYKKAMSLFPEHLELQVSYAWMLLLANQHKQAKQVAQKLAEKHGQHPLVRGLSLLIKGDFSKAENYLRQSANQIFLDSL